MMKNGAFMLLLGIGIGATAFATYGQLKNGHLKKIMNDMKYKAGMNHANTMNSNKSL